MDSKAYQLSLEVLAELCRARGKFPAFHSAHEGIGVLFEEVCELWDEVREKNADADKMRGEAIQVAAMAMRFVLDVCDAGKE